MTTIRMTTAVLGLAALVAVMTGCASTTSQETTPAATMPAASATAGPVATTLPDPTYPAPTTCPQFMMTAAHLATDWQYLGLGLGTTNDEGPTLADLKVGSAGMQDLAAECAPKAVEEIDAFAATVDPVIAVYTTQPAGDQVAQVDAALADMQTAGAEMFTALDMATYAWE